MFKKKILTTSLLTFLFLTFFLSFLRLSSSAQIQTTPFSGNDPASYQCIGTNGQIDSDSASKVYKDDVSGSFLCRGIDRDGDGKDDKAIIKPPALQQVEIWFVRIVYVIWALVGSYSFILLVFLGYQYMLRGGTSDEELVKLRKRIINYIIGFALVFLAIPILSTFFRLLNINTDVQCYNVNMPGFQFFFANLCTAPTLVSDPCSAQNTEGKACNIPNQTADCFPNPTFEVVYICDPTNLTWRIQ